MIDQLRRIDLFDGLTDEQLAEWAALTKIRDVPADTVLLEEKVDSPGPLLLFDGTVTTRQHNEWLTPNVGPTWVGAIAAITESPVPVEVRSSTACRAAIVPRDRFIELALRHPSVHQKVMHLIGPVMRSVQARETNRAR